MIKVTKMNGEEMVVNAELIETVKATPDIVISLTTGKKILVLEDIEEIIERVINYRQRVLAGVGRQEG